MKTILIVDDEDSLRKGMAMTLTKKGYRALEAEDGMVGLSVATEQKPDLIISDVYMDNMNGFIMVENLQQDPETAAIPVILMTSAAQAAGAWTVVGAVEYMNKPFTMDALLTTVKRVLKE
ncbi:MAG TPA: response regulator [Bacteroidota bacterium]|nr:response regulator [Bacteroidota bacterium]